MEKISMLKCSYCKEKFPKDELIQETKTKKICPNCYATKKQEADDYKNLIKYICDGFRIKAPTGQQLRSIKEFKELGYTYRDIQYTIYYIFVVERKKPNGTGIGLVPFYYEKAMQHKKFNENARRTASKVALKPIVVVGGEKTKPKLDKTRLINIDDLF